MPLAAGDLIAARYKLLAKIGEGAHGVVFRARDLETREEVAIKFLRAGLGVEADFQRRLEREAKAMAQLRGTCAAYVHALRIDDDGRSYLVMEMLHGKDFESYLRGAEDRGGRIKAARMLELLRPVAATLELAHAQSVVHRDLKPANIMVLDSGGVRLLDFGLVKLLDENTLTGPGMIAGSPSYIAPEAWGGDARALDHRIDVFSLGVIVFRALAGRTPGNTRTVPQALLFATRGERPSLHALRAKLPLAIDAWVARALAIDPKDRFQSVREMWDTLESLVGTRPEAPF